MRLNTVEEIEHAIGTLTPQELEELCLWLDQCAPTRSIPASNPILRPAILAKSSGEP